MDRGFVVGLLRDWGLALVVAVVIFVGWSWLFGGAGTPSGEAPDFSLQDLQGESITLSELQGQPVVLNFWATWCGPCKAEIPELSDFAEAHDDVPLLGISTDRDMASGRLARWVEARGIPYRILHDRSGAVAGAWGVSTLPTTFVLSADGHVVAHRKGMIDRQDLEAMVAEARAHSH